MMAPDYWVLLSQGPRVGEPDRTHVLLETQETLVIWECGCPRKDSGRVFDQRSCSG